MKKVHKYSQSLYSGCCQLFPLFSFAAQHLQFIDVVNESSLGNAEVPSSQQIDSVDDILKDPEKCLEILKKLGLPDPSVPYP